MAESQEVKASVLNRKDYNATLNRKDYNATEYKRSIPKVFRLSIL